MPTVWHIASDLDALEFRWLHVKCDAAAILKALAHLRGPCRSRAVANWLVKHQGGPVMPTDLAALRVGLQSERAQDALALWIAQGWLGRG